MKNAIAVTLIVMGALVILGPVRSSGYGGYDTACWVAGVGMVLLGFVRSRPPAVGPA